MITEIFPDTEAVRFVTEEEKRQCVERADHVICVSERTRRDLVRLFNVPGEKTSVIYHGVEPLTEGEESPSPFPELEPFLLFVGRRAGYKNFRGLLEAYRSSDRLSGEIKLVAFGGEPFDAGERALLEEWNLGESIRHRSGDDHLLGRLYSRAEALVLPSLYEGFGMPALEAMIHGCPVIASDRGSLPEIVGDAARLVNPEDTGAMKRALEEVLESESRKAELVARGRKRAGHFGWDVTARKTAEIYRGVLEGTL